MTKFSPLKCDLKLPEFSATLSLKIFSSEKKLCHHIKSHALNKDEGFVWSAIFSCSELRDFEKSFKSNPYPTELLKVFSGRLCQELSNSVAIPLYAVWTGRVFPFDDGQRIQRETQAARGWGVAGGKGISSLHFLSSNGLVLVVDKKM